MLGVHVAKNSKVLDKKKPDKNGVFMKKTRKTLTAAILEDANELQLSAVQIYTHGPRNFKVNGMDYPEVKKVLIDNKIILVVHGSYVSAGIWKVNEENSGTANSKIFISHIISQLKVCNELGAYGLILHLPKQEQAVVIATLKTKIIYKAILKFKVLILLEMVPVKNGAESNIAYVTPNQINSLVRSIDELKLSNLCGICVDTAHLWGAGIDVKSASSMKNWLSEIEKPNMIKLFHLNGSQNDTWNTGRDVHIIAFNEEDDMYSSKVNPSIEDTKKTGVYPIIQFCMDLKIPIICEINRGSEEDVRRSLHIMQSLASV